MRKWPLRFLLILAIISPVLLFSQDIKTATSVFSDVAELYSGIVDYSADVTINVDGTIMQGSLQYHRPNKIRIDFTVPDKQVIVSDGDVLQVYIPKYDVTLVQKLDPNGTDKSAGAGIASQEGLSLLQKGFGIAYKVGPNPVPLDDNGGSAEQVIKLMLNWRNQNQGFRQIEISLTQSKLIRRILGVTADNKRVRIDYTNIKLNQGIPLTRFDYDSPATANQFQGFLNGN